MPDSYILISTLAQRAGVAASALRFYETQGLLVSVRSSGGQRQYTRSALRRVAFIRAAQAVGLSLDDIRAALATLPDQRTPTQTDWARLSRRWQPLLDARIAALIQLREQLAACIGCGCLSLQRCKLYNPQDVAATRGSGPRFLMGDRSADVRADHASLESKPAKRSQRHGQSNLIS
jgi:MerR family transcriptional regulator, redox-sensitive transcriptional activator SoxR